MIPGTNTMPDGLGLRPARPADNGFIESLYRSTRDDLQLIDAEQEFIETLIEQQHHAQTEGYGDLFPNAMYFIVEKQGESIGRVVIDFGMNEIRLVDVALIPTARNKGYGKSIVQTLQYAAGSARAPLYLSVLKMNQPARQLYHQLGFQFAEASDTHDLLVWYPEAFRRDNSV